MDIIIEIVKPYWQNLSKVNHKFKIVWIEMQTDAEYIIIIEIVKPY